jgi:phage head maturation protease
MSTQPIEIRSATAVEVHRALRELDLVIAPAEVPATIYERSRSYTEVFSHGAFAGCETNPGRVKVNRDHQHERVIGKALRLNPWDEQGLTGTVKLSRVRDADEALALIDDDVLSVSAGFAIASNGDEWRGTADGYAEQ